MATETKPFNSVARNFLQRKNQIACRHGYDMVMRGRGRTVLDDSRTLAITAWTCARCGGVIEEVALWCKAERRNHVRFGTPWCHGTRTDDRCRLSNVCSGTEVERSRWPAEVGYENGAQSIE
jgi:hypothetical protein